MLLRLLLLPGLQSSRGTSCRNAIEHEAGIYAFLFGYGGASLRQMGSQAVNATLGKVFAAKFTSLGVSVCKTISPYAPSIRLQGPKLGGPKWQTSTPGGGRSRRSRGRGQRCSPIRIVCQLGTPLEVLLNHLVRPATHGGECLPRQAWICSTRLQCLEVLVRLVRVGVDFLEILLVEILAAKVTSSERSKR